MSARISAGVVGGATASIALVVGHSELVRSCGRPSWLDFVSTHVTSPRVLPAGSSVDAPNGIICDYFPSTIESLGNFASIAAFFLVGGIVAGLISNRFRWQCGGAGALLGAIVVESPIAAILLRELQRMDARMSAYLEIVAWATLSTLVAACAGSLGGAATLKLWPNISVERARGK